MNKYFNPRLLNAVIAGTGMKNPVRPHVVLGDQTNGFIRGDLMDANAIVEIADQKIKELVNAAPEALDTLKELADALNDDSNFAANIIAAINQKQNTLISGENIKTINGSSILGEGNIVLDTSTYKDLPETWDTTHSMTELIASINADEAAIPGKSYLGTVSLSDLPAGMMQAELIIDIMDQLDVDGSKVIVFSLSSADISPYKWEYTSAYGRLGTWRSWVIEQQQADWNLTNTSAVDYIKNKPNVALKSDLSTIDANGHDYVEIGGIKWATMNIGANSVTDTGLYFQWGDTQGYTASQVGSGAGQKYFGWADYKYGDGTSSPGATGMTKYNSSDSKTVLEAGDDAARANWGGSWRMPTTAEFQALGDAVNTAWTADYQGSGIAGLVCTDKQDSSKVLFFPATKFCFNGNVIDYADNNLYWSSSLSTNTKNNACCFYLTSSNILWDTGIGRNYGLAVRGVLDVEDKYATKAEVEEVQSNIVQSDWNQSDSTAIDYIKNKPTIPSLSGYATESWVGQQGYLTSHQDISGKEDKTVIEAASGATLTAQVGKYYTLSNVGTLAITLPTCTGTKTQSVIFYMSTGTTPAVTFTSTHSILYSDGFGIESGSAYEINALWNGSAWIIVQAIVVTSNS